MQRDAFSRLFRAVTKYYSTATAIRNMPLFMVFVGISFKKAWKKKKKKHRELVILICRAVTKTVQKEQNTSGLITTGGNSSFKCTFLLWQYQTGKEKAIE